MKENHAGSIAGNRPRIAYLDALKVISMFAVMVIHLAATGYTTAVPKSYEWVVCLIYNSIARFAVPVFVMISGAMYLNPEREITMEHLLKRIGKLMTVFFFWSLVYALAESLEEHMLFSAGYFQSVIEKTITGHYHMWYIYMIAGLYLATPFLRPIAADRKLLRMFILAAFLLNFCTRFLSGIPGLEKVIGSVVSRADLGIFSGFTGYYCLGYYLHSESFSKREIRKLSVTLALPAVAAVVICILFDRPSALITEKMPHIFAYSAGVFLLFKGADRRLAGSSRIQAIIGKIVPCSLGMYLIHPVFNLILRKAGLYALTFNPLLCIPLCGALVCTVSFSFVSCLRKIPLIRRFV